MGEEIEVERSRFKVELKLLALRIRKEDCVLLSKALSGHLLHKHRVKHIVLDPEDDGTRLVLLSENITDPSLSQIPEAKLKLLKSQVEWEVVPHNIELDYSYWPVDHILKEILPKGCNIPSSFETIGHIAHLNLPNNLLSYRKIIGTVILEKNQPKIKTVVNKVETICNEFRVPTFEVLAGSESLVTEVKQHGTTFQLDYGLVYWNSRLEYEHKRLVSKFGKGQVICDMFAGIGPFAIPAAQLGCTVLANDLNPDSVKYLKINANINKVVGSVHVFNMDARGFMRYLCELEVSQTDPKVGMMEAESCECSISKDDNNGQEVSCSSIKEDAMSIFCSGKKEDNSYGATNHANKRRKMSPIVNSDQIPIIGQFDHIDHVIMNLPAFALEFLDVFQGLFSRSKWKGNLPWVHCYCFMRSNETIDDILKRAQRILNCSIKKPEVWTVRDVAPNKVMLCLSFILPESILFL